jgi:hypothetical protein
MKSNFITSLLILAFFSICQLGFSQETVKEIAMQTKAEADKQELINAYSWMKTHFENSVNPIVSVKEMQAAGGSKFIFIESKDSNVMFDSDGKKYCADGKDFSCMEFYKLNEASLSWAKS